MRVIIVCLIVFLVGGLWIRDRVEGMVNQSISLDAFCSPGLSPTPQFCEPSDLKVIMDSGRRLQDTFNPQKVGLNK